MRGTPPGRRTPRIGPFISSSRNWRRAPGPSPAPPASGPPPTAPPDNLISCLYPSGSPGTPKGVLLEHRNVTRLLVNDRLQFSFTADDVWTMFHSYCFDFSVWEMY